MIMKVCDAVETLLSPSQFELLKQPMFSEHLEIAVHRAETNPGQPPANKLIDFARGRMPAVSSKLLQNRPALPRYSQLHIGHDLQCLGLLQMLQNDNSNHSQVIYKKISPLSSLFFARGI